MRIIGARRRLGSPVPRFVTDIVSLDRLDDALALADHVVVSLPLTAATRRLLDADRLAAMRRGAYLYNVGRGAVVDTEALIAALGAGHLAGAGLDVVDPEPLPPDSPLWAMPNVLITAHSAGATPRYWERAIEIVATNIGRYRAGQQLLNQVDLEAGY
jgi:phosphoglycerate dehydrogenase-like enzyme